MDPSFTIRVVVPSNAPIQLPDHTILNHNREPGELILWEAVYNGATLEGFIVVTFDIEVSYDRWS